MMDTYSFSNSGDGLFSRDDTDVFAILDKLVVRSTCKVGERLDFVHIRAIEECLRKRWNIGDDTGWVDALEDVVGEQGADGNGVVLVLDGLALRDIAWYGCECIVCRSENGDVGSGRERVC